ncbi:MAG TPA: glutaredoxin domain-containing protein [Dermatophilaceae bacterium]|nr:glutaredoxin domain-containing protein [Dermatophilaceae bacterium]
MTDRGGPTPHPVMPEAGDVVVYATTWCPYCAMLLVGLRSAGIPALVIDIDRDQLAAAFVEGVNGGNRTVPTVVFANGTILTNPPPEVVAHRASAEADRPASPRPPSPDPSSTSN